MNASCFNDNILFSPRPYEIWLINLLEFLTETLMSSKIFSQQFISPSGWMFYDTFKISSRYQTWAIKKPAGLNIMRHFRPYISAIMDYTNILKQILCIFSKVVQTSRTMSNKWKYIISVCLFKSGDEQDKCQININEK